MSTDRFKFKLAASTPAVDVAGGTIWEANQKSFPILKGLAAFLLRIHEGAVRIPHWHPDANELDYILTGRATIRLVGPDQVEQRIELEPGDVSFIPQGWFHSIANTGEGDLNILVVFNNESPNDIGISGALGGMSESVLGETLGVPASTFSNFRKDVRFIAPQ